MNKNDTSNNNSNNNDNNHNDNIDNDNNDKNNDNDNDDNNSIDNKDFDNYEIFTNIMHLYVRTDGIPREINAEELKKQILRVRNVLYHAQTGCL